MITILRKILISMIVLLASAQIGGCATVGHHTENTPEELEGGVIAGICYSDESHAQEEDDKELIHVYDANKEPRMISLSESGFLDEYRFTNASPFYTYYKNEHSDVCSLAQKLSPHRSLYTGIVDLTLYFDETNNKGCGMQEGLNGYTMGFVIDEVLEETWENINYKEPFSAGQYLYGYDVEPIDLVNIKHDSEYDERGNLISYVVSSDVVVNEKPRRSKLEYEIHFQYDDNNILRYRIYHCANTIDFVGERNIWEIYFDDKGRIEYENYYLTHGWYYIYYIYLGDGEVPSFGLFIDCNLGARIVDKFVRYK